MFLSAPLGEPKAMPTPRPAWTVLAGVPLLMHDNSSEMERC